MINSLDKEILGRGNIESYKLIVSNSNYSFDIQKKHHYQNSFILRCIK